MCQRYYGGLRVCQLPAAPLARHFCQSLRPFLGIVPGFFRHLTPGVLRGCAVEAFLACASDPTRGDLAGFPTAGPHSSASPVMTGHEPVGHQATRLVAQFLRLTHQRSVLLDANGVLPSVTISFQPVKLQPLCMPLCSIAAEWISSTQCFPVLRMVITLIYRESCR